MDVWQPEQIEFMLKGGNEAIREYFVSRSEALDVPPDRKYRTPTAELYRQVR